MASTIQVRVDEELKLKADNLFKDLGTDTTSAIRMFLTQAVAHNGFPFEIRKNVVENNPFAPMTEAELLSKLENSRTNAALGKCRPADDVISDMRKKYGI